MLHFGMTSVAAGASRAVVLVAVAFVAWLWLLIAFRRIGPPVAGLLAALLSWALASVSTPWIVGALQQHHVWPFV
jgi:hypothetical protein